MTNDSQAFFKDGFTDISGKFVYSKASGASSRNNSSFKKFAIFASHKELGCMIKEADATKLKSNRVISS
jgi:hypothetical protein